jgi:hypothetical protein
VDTVSFGYRPTSEAVFAAAKAAPHRPGPAGALICDGRGPDGGRLIVWPGHRLVAYESRLAALLAGDAGEHGLATVSELPAGSGCARLAADEILGADPGEDGAEVRRFDLAAEVLFKQPAEGFAFLASLRGICPPRARTTQEVDVTGAVMTAYVRTERRGVVLSRIYDKGRESGSHRPGLRVRIESQNRPPKAARHTPETLAKLNLAPTFGRTMKHYLTAEQLVTAGPDGAAAELVAKAHKGEIGFLRAERLAGSVAFLKYAGRCAYHDPDNSAKENNRRSARRLKALRDAGIALEHELDPEAVVPVSQIMRDAIEGFAA